MNVEKQLDYQGSKIFYRTIGSGKPVFLIHGFGEDGSVWRPPQTPPMEGISNSQSQLFENSLLIGNFKFIIPDLPGSGRSEMIGDMSMEGMAEVIKAIANVEFSKAPRLNRKSIIIGHSMGGYITLAFAEKYPEYIKAIGLFHSSSFPDSEEKKASRRKGISFINQHGAFEFLKTVIPNLFSPVSKDEMPENIDEFTRQQNNFSAAALVSYYTAMMQRPDRTSVLIQAKIPFLFIMGKYDTAIPIEDSLKQCHLPEKSYIHILERSGHMGMMEEPDKSNRAIKDFLQHT